MPYIQVDVREGLSEQELAELGARIVDIVHESIGSARAHINVAIRQIPSEGLIESGGTATSGVSC
ncbi:4-oxalocrotonate tautomerase family protein [Streptomyces sp. NPDC058464]|uniref:tautomerase family protein n=1 Tax=unclassified Streptomyces TaxID=2593676 RepID=UPI00364E026E